MHLFIGASGALAAVNLPQYVIAVTSPGGVEVTVALTRSARQFVSPLALSALGARVVHETVDVEACAHALARRADVVAILPASAHTIGRLAAGRASDLVTAVALSAVSPVLVYPSLNAAMGEHPAMVANLARLADFRYDVVQAEADVFDANTRSPRRATSMPMPSAFASQVRERARPAAVRPIGEDTA